MQPPPTPAPVRPPPPPQPPRPRRLPPWRLALLLALLAVLAGDGDWWHRDWWGDWWGGRWGGRWGGTMHAWLDRLTPPPPLADMPAPACLRALAASGAGFVRRADFATGAGCRVDAAVRVESLGGAALSAPFVAACPLALALQRHAVATLQPAAVDLLGSRIARIDHVGSFACRRIRGRPNGPLSEHAFGRALDVAGYVTAAGRTVTPAAGWADAAAPAGRFLRRVTAARRPFSTVLTPADDRRHHDHLHFGVRPPRP